MSALYTNTLARESGKKNVLNHGADTQKSLLCSGEKGKGEKILNLKIKKELEKKKEREENAWEV